MKKDEWVEREVLRETSPLSVPFLQNLPSEERKYAYNPFDLLDEEGQCDKLLSCPDGIMRTPHRIKNKNWHVYVSPAGERHVVRCPKAKDHNQ
jgi:hypothetical protein